MPDVPDLLRQSQRERRRSISVRSGGEPVAAKVGEIMGVSAGASVKKVAFVKCAEPVRKQNRITSIPEWKIVRQWHLFQMADQSPAIMDVWDLEIV